MAIEKYTCEKHGESTAYVYTIKSGISKGLKRRTCRQCRSEQVKIEWKNVKANLINAYGGKCLCCGESESAFLTLDHKHGDGSKHRKQGLRGWRLYQWLAKQGYPKKGYRLLCFNCNCARGQFGKCPHKRRKT